MKQLISLIAVLLLPAVALAESGRPIIKGSTDQTTYIRIIDSVDGTPETGVIAATAGLDLEYVRVGAAAVDLTESDLASAVAAHSDGGIFHVGHGMYRVDLPDAANATGVDEVIVQGTVTGMIVLPVRHPLTNFDAAGTAGTQLSEAFDNDATGGDMDLTSLNVVNSSGNAVVFQSSGGNGNGFQMIGNGTGSAMLGLGGASGGFGMTFSGQGAPGFRAANISGNAPGFQVLGNGTGDGMEVTAGATGEDIDANIAGKINGQRTWYLDDDTDGAGDTGEASAPFDTWAAAQSAASYGDTIYIVGTYSDIISVTKSGLTITGSGSVSSAHTGASLGAIHLTAGVSNTTVIGLTVSGTDATDGTGIRFGGSVATYGYNNKLIGCVINGVYDGAFFTYQRGLVIKDTFVEGDFDGGYFAFCNGQIINSRFLTDGSYAATGGIGHRGIVAGLDNNLTFDGGWLGVRRTIDDNNNEVFAFGTAEITGSGTTNDSYYEFNGTNFYAATTNASDDEIVNGIGAQSVVGTRYPYRVVVNGGRIVTSSAGGGTNYDVFAPSGSDVELNNVSHTTADLSGSTIRVGPRSNSSGHVDRVTLTDTATVLTEEIANAGSLHATTIATLSSQTSFTLTAGSPDNDAYNECLAIITDASDSTQKALVYIADYVGSTRTVTLEASPLFTIAASDSISIIEAKPRGGPFANLTVPSARRLLAKDRGDGTFGVVGRVRQTAGETLWWSVEFKGTQLSAGDLVDAIDSVTLTGAQAANATIADYDVDDTEAGFKLTLSGSATSSDTINVKITITPESGETFIVTVPVTVGG